MSDDPSVQFVQFMAGVAQKNAEGRSWAAGMQHLSVAHLLLDRARMWGPVVDDLSEFVLPSREKKACFQNAYSAAARSGGRLFYVEGFATSMIPTLHAWTVTADGRVVDPTWDDGQSYFGVPFDFGWLSEWLGRTEVWGVFGGEHGDLQTLLNGGLPETALPSELTLPEHQVPAEPPDLPF